jgi:predicted transcriptional regulator
MISKSTKKSIGIVLFILLALVLLPALGWSQGQEAQGQAAQVEVSDDEIVTFAKAQIQVSSIRQKYQEKLPNVTDQVEQQNMIQEMNEELVSAVQNVGLSVERYNTIFNALQNDPALSQGVSEAMQRMQ